MTSEGQTEFGPAGAVKAFVTRECVERGVTCRRGFDRWPEGTCSPHPAVTACPWASAGIGPAGAGSPHTQSFACPRPRSGTRPAVQQKSEIR